MMNLKMKGNTKPNFSWWNRTMNPPKLEANIHGHKIPKIPFHLCLQDSMKLETMYINVLVQFFHLILSLQLLIALLSPGMTNKLRIQKIIQPYHKGGLLKPPEQKSHFWHLFVIQMTPKNLTFPKYLWQCLPYSFGVSKWPKNGFL